MPFSIEVIYGKDSESSGVKTSGEEVKLLTNELYPAFGISTDLLKDAVKAFLGKRPDAIYVNDPTPGNWYAAKSWEPVTLRLHPIDGEIVSVDTATTQLKSQVFHNRSSKPGTFDVSITEDVSDTVETNWSESISIGVTQSINYGIELIGGDTSISFQTDFQKGGSKSRTVSMGQSSGVTVDLGPGESVTATLTAAKGTMRVRVRFEAYLTGVIAAYYEGSFKYQHVLPVDIAAALQALGGSHTLSSINDIAIDCFSSGEIVLEDPTGRRIRLHALPNGKN